MSFVKSARIALIAATLVLMGFVNTQAQQSRWVDSTLASMTLEEKVGQLFVADLVAIYSNRESPNFRLALEAMDATFEKYLLGGDRAIRLSRGAGLQ